MVPIPERSIMRATYVSEHSPASPLASGVAVMSKYFTLPFTVTIGGVLGFAVSVWLFMWIGHKLPIIGPRLRGV